MPVLCASARASRAYNTYACTQFARTVPDRSLTHLNALRPSKGWSCVGAHEVRSADSCCRCCRGVRVCGEFCGTVMCSTLVSSSDGDDHVCLRWYMCACLHVLVHMCTAVVALVLAISSHHARAYACARAHACRAVSHVACMCMAVSHVYGCVAATSATSGVHMYACVYLVLMITHMHVYVRLCNVTGSCTSVQASNVDTLSDCYACTIASASARARARVTIPHDTYTYMWAMTCICAGATGVTTKLKI